MYGKALRLSTRSRQAVEAGKGVNLMSVDANTVAQFPVPFALQLVSAPLTVGGGGRGGVGGRGWRGREVAAWGAGAPTAAAPPAQP